nr:hypothetical protein [Streptomyces antimycoticus]
MTPFDEVLHDLPYALALGRVHTVDAGVGDPAADGDGDRAVSQRVDVRGLRVGAEQQGFVGPVWGGPLMALRVIRRMELRGA